MRNTSSRSLVRGTRRYFIYFFLSILLVILTSMGTFEIIKRTDLLKLEKVEVIGESNDLNFHIEQDLQANLGVNLYKLNLETIKDTLAHSYPIIAELKVKRKILSKLKVYYFLETPFAIANFSDGKNYYISRDLKILERVGYGYFKKSLPVITVKHDTKNYKIGDFIEAGEAHEMADYLSQILEARPDFHDRISDLFIKNNKVYFREISRGNTVYFGNGNLSNKIDLFLSHCNSFSSGLYIDVSYERQIVTRKADF